MAIRDLREKHHLLSEHEGCKEVLDCHPLIREYFGKQLQTQHPTAWQQAHAKLYDYYKVLPKKVFPDTLEEMQPLFSAVAHGCAAGLHQQALEEVYWPRIRREDEAYIVKKIGAFSDDLATVAHFFTTPWQIPAASLAEHDKATVMSWAGFDLCALGRLREAIKLMQADVAIAVKHKDWRGVSRAASNLSELQLILGDIIEAINSAASSVVYADWSGDRFLRMALRSTQADALHQAGHVAQALELCQAAEVLQQEDQVEYPRLYSLSGFYYCNLLLAHGETEAVLEIVKYTIEIAKSNNWLLDIALDQLLLGQACLQQFVKATPPNLPFSGEKKDQAADWLEQAVAGLRAAGQFQYLPLGLLARAALFRHIHEFTRAHADLQEVFEIAEPSGMRLYLTDYHLDMARLLIAEGKEPTSKIRKHVEKAEKLINDTGYHRRDKELAELRNYLTGGIV